MDQQKPSKLSTGTIILMLVVVCMYEAVNALLNTDTPGIGPFLSGIIADLHFYVWFKMKGVNFTRNPKRALGWIGSLFFNEIEVIDEVSLPLGVIFTILSVRKEEKLENSKAQAFVPRKKLKKSRAPLPPRQPRIMRDIQAPPDPENETNNDELMLSS